MHGTISVRSREPTETVRQVCPPTDIFVGDVLSDIAKRILWPENTAANLAALCGCSVRQAERYIGGRDWSGDAVAALIQEITRRHSMRNVKILPKR
jgi:hypothetical protein